MRCGSMFKGLKKLFKNFEKKIEKVYQKKSERKMNKKDF
jgi:hypothetical protein